MIYLDYRNVTPLLSSVLDSYIDTTKKYMGSIYVDNKIGHEANRLLHDKTSQLAKLFDVSSDELLFTNGYTEGLNLFFKGILSARENLGKTIILSHMEQDVVYKICESLKANGYKIQYVDNDENGIIDFNDLKSKINSSTTAVFVSAITYSKGIRQPLKTIKQVIRKENPNTLLACDMSLAPGRMPINLNDVDVGIFSSKTSYGPKGVGFIYKRINLPLKPIMIGIDNKVCNIDYLPLINSMVTAYKEITTNLNKKDVKVKELYDLLEDNLNENAHITMNRTKYTVNSIINLSIKDCNYEELIEFLEKKDIIVSYEKEEDEFNLIISISHLTTKDEINKFCKLINIYLNK